jgi:hypothetical protein
MLVVRMTGSTDGATFDVADEAGDAMQRVSLFGREDGPQLPLGDAARVPPSRRL